ncbi:hypothetical protein GF380_02800, partial [Candidatus Uhrbacteria bacterium]|nr:hypothetical protein [Candidatus Uhrbacteria bacterium]MBD3284081.1 hypothetical protein [Candidatus Uhrbacteria bacterium]
SQHIVVSSVVPDQRLQNPFVILGRARAFENTINWRIRDNREQVIAEGFATTNAPDVGRFGSFRIRAFYMDMPETDTGTVEVFTLSARDGSEQDMVRIPVRLNREVLPVKIFFSNIEQDPNATFCDRVYPVTRRIPKTVNVAEATVLELLKGPSIREQSMGNRTSIYPGTKLRSINLDDRVITVDLSKEFTYALSGSCMVQAITSQINQTLTQFETIDVARVLIEGQDAELELQP